MKWRPIGARVGRSQRQFLKGLENGPKAHRMNGCHDGALAFTDRAGIASVALECLCYVVVLHPGEG
jgi:hypothetical protein